MGLCSGLMELCLDFTEGQFLLCWWAPQRYTGSGPAQSVPADGMYGWRVEPQWVLWVAGPHSPSVTSAPLRGSLLLGPGMRQQVQRKHPPSGVGGVPIQCRQHRGSTPPGPHSPVPSFLLWDQGNSRLQSCRCSKLLLLITGGDRDWAGQMLFRVRDQRNPRDPDLYGVPHFILNAAESVLFLLEKKSQVHLCWDLGGHM